MKNVSRILWGLVLVILGVIWALNALDIAHINIFFKGWWTLFIIVPSMINLFGDDKSSKSGDAIAIFVGVLLLLACWDVLEFSIIWKLALPLVVVVIGLSLIFGINGKANEKVREIIKKHEDEDKDHITATFGENEIKRNKNAFKNSNVDAIFGGVKIDLRDSKLADETIIKASAIFGGIEIIVPEDVKIVVKSTPIFGGISNKADSKEDAKKVIYIDALVMFGGMEIK